MPMRSLSTRNDRAPIVALLPDAIAANTMVKPDER